jgi:hypothetical protein
MSEQKDQKRLISEIPFWFPKPTGKMALPFAKIEGTFYWQEKDGTWKRVNPGVDKNESTNPTREINTDRRILVTL